MGSNSHSTAGREERQGLPAQPLRLLALAVLPALVFLLTGFGPPIITDGGYPPVRLAPEHVDALVRSRTVPTITATFRGPDRPGERQDAFREGRRPSR